MSAQPLLILLVEDNENDYLIVRDVLRDVWHDGGAERLPYELKWAETFDGGLDALQNSPERQPDVILLDYHLDVGTGLEFFEAARLRGCAAPFLLLTGQSDHAVDVRAMRAGIADYVVKDQLSGVLLERAIRYAVEGARSAQALRESERRFRALIENSSEGILLLDEGAQICYASPAIKRILGFSPEEVLGKSASELVFPAERADLGFKWRDLLAAAGATGVWQHRVRHRDGSWRWIESSVSNLLHDPGVRAVVNNYRDISERVRAENELRHSEARYRTLFETNPQPALVYERDSLRFLAVNRAAVEHYGYSEAEFFTLTLRAIRPAAHVADLLEHLGSKPRNGRQEQVWKHLRKDGSLIEVQMSANDLIYDGREARLVVINDITRQQRDQETLRRSEERYRSLVRASSQILCIATADASIVLSDDWTRFTGQNPAHIHGSGWIEAVHPKDRPEVKEIWLRALETKAFQAAEYRLQRADGSYCYVLTRFVPVLEASGAVREWVSMTTDISGRKSAEAERDRFFTLSLDLMCIAGGDGYFKRLNPAFEQVLGYSCEEMMAAPIADFLHPDDVIATAEEIDTKAKLTTNTTFLNRFRCCDGSYRWFSWTAAWRDGLCYATARDVTDLKEAEARLRHSLSLLQATLEATADGILVVDSAGQITDYNRKFLTMWGIADDLMGQNGQVFDRAQEQLLEPESFLRSFGNNSDTDYDLLLFKDGRVIARYSQPQTLDGEHLGHVWSFRDITQRIQAKAVQEQLTAQVQQERQHLDEILANVPGIVWERYGEAETPDPRDYVNSYVEVLLGYSAQQWLSMPRFWSQIVHPDDRESTLHKRARIAETGQSDILQYRLISRSGHAIWVESHCTAIRDDDGAVMGLRGVIMDISARRKASEEQARLAILLENTSDFVSWMDTNHQVRYINRAGRQMLGFSLDENISIETPNEVHPAWTMDILKREALPSAMQHGTWVGETALLRRDGTEIPVSQVIIAPKDEHGELLFFSTICRDVSQQKQVEAALQKANDELEQRVIERTAALERANQELMVAKEEAERANGAKSDFLSRMSHELRTPLNAILGFGQILELHSLEAKEEECVVQILRAGRHLLGLINEVLDIARIESGRLSLDFEPLEVALLVRESLAMVRPQAAERGVQLINAIDDASAESVLADRGRLHQVMLNLLSNAIKYNGEGGSVTVSCRLIEADQWTTHRRVRLEVRDTGPGLSPEDQQLIFVPFERLGLERSKIEGTGIGLALCRHLIQAMHGRIGVQSEVGHGSLFWIEVPCAIAPAAPLPMNSPIARQYTVPELIGSIPASTVLYIEDNLSNIQLMENLLRDAPQIRLICARQGDIGLENARQHLPDLILLDLHLPVLEGREVLHQLQISPQTRDIPVVVLSADATQAQMQSLLSAGAKHYLMKPFDVEQLLHMLEQMLRD
ncbi:MAG TPA: PAS domain S-box protein [Abditibacterium sp.]|jgi:PAS domain S-box-containing protein